MKMEIIGPLIITLLTGLSTLIGLVFTYIKIKDLNKIISLFLSFSSIILIIMVLKELLPNSYSILINKYDLLFGNIITILVFSLGYQTIYFLNKNIEIDSNLYRIGYISMISLIIHNILEGMIVFISSYGRVEYSWSLVAAMSIHNIVEGIIIAIPIYYSNKNRGETLKKLFIASISEFIGALLSIFIFKEQINEIILSYMMIFISGIMISLVINDIYIEIKEYYIKKYTIIGILTSLIISIIIF